MEKKHISAYKNAGLKTNRLTKRTSHERVSAYDSAQRSKKNRGGILGGAGYIAGNLGLGAAGVAEGIGDIVSAGADLLRGDTDMAKYRFIDNPTAEAQQRLAETYNPGTIMKGAGDVASGIGSSLTFMIPYVGPYLAGAGYVGMGISSAAGYTGDVGMNEITYGAISGGSELLMDMFLGGAGKAAKNIGSSITRKIGKEAAEAGAKATAKLAGKSFGKSVLKETLKGAAGEAAEEAAQEAIDPFLLRLFNIDENAEFSLANVAYAGLIGGLSGGLMTAGPAAINYKSASRTGKAIRESGETEDFLQYTKQVLSGADRKIGKYKAAREATVSAGEDAGAIGKAKTAVGNTISSIRTKRAEKRVADMAEKVRKNLDTYEGYLNKVDKTAKELEISDAVLGELRGNVFLLENASLLESYEEAILSEDEDVKQALVDDFNERAKAGGGEKFDYTVADLEANADDMLSAIASRYMMEDAYGQYMKRSERASRRGNAAEAAEVAREGAREAGAEEVDTGDASADTELFNGSTEDAWSVVTDETAGDYPVQSRDEVELIQAAINNDIPKASIPAMMDSYRAGTSLSPQEFAEGWADGVILFGKYNVDEGGIDPESALGRMEESSRKAAIQYGREASMKERGEAVRKADEKRRADGERAGEAPVVRHPGIYLKQDLNDAQYAAYKAAEIMSKALNTDIEIRKSLSRNGKTVNGYFDKGSNTLVININAMRDGRHIALYTLGHEVTHYIREWSPEKFYEMGDFVIERLGTGAEKIIRDKLAFLEKTGQIEGKSASEAYEIAYEEVVADGMESVLADGTVLNELARENKTLWQKIKDRITEIIAKIKKAYGELKGTSRTAQILAETMDSLDELEQLFYEGVVEAGEVRVKESDGTDTDVRYSIEDSEGNEIPDVSEKAKDIERLEKENRDLSEKVRRMQYGMFRRAVESGEADARRHGRELSKAADTVLASIGVSDGKNRGRLLQKMKELYARLAAKDAISYEKAFTEAGEIAEWLISKQDVERDSTEANEIMKNLHGTKIRLTTTQKEEITQRWGSLDAFRKDMFGKVTISDKDGVPLDVQWAEWADQYPEIFSGDVAEADMPDRLEKLYRDIMEERDRVEPVEEYIDREVLTATIFSEVGQIGWKADAALVNEYTLLADSFEDAITSEQEYRIVKKYKEKSYDMEKSDKRLKELRKEVSELNHEIEALTNRIRGVEKSKREVWVLTALDEATARKSELLKEMNRISDSMRRDIDQLLSLRAAEPIRRAFQEEKKRADTLEKKAEKEAQRARNAEELAKDTVKKAYEKADERGRKYKEKVDRMAEESRERGEITTRKRTVMRVLGTLTTKLYNPTRTNHVSKELHDLAMKTLAAVDPKAFGENRNHIKELGELSKKIERLERKAARTALEQENLDKWKDRYEKLEAETVSLRKQAEAMLAAFIEYNENAPEEIRYPEAILDIMKDQVGEIEDVPLARMGLRSLEAVETFVTMLDHQVANANKLFTLERDQTMSETGEKAIKEIDDKKALKFLSPKAMEFKGLDQIRKFFWKNMKPMTVFEAIGSDTLAELFKNVIDGEGTWAQDIMEAREKILETRDKFGYDKWKLDERREVETKSGKVNLSLSEMMSLYAYSFRKQAYSHLEGGGFVLNPNATDTVTGKTLTFAQIEKRLNNSQRYTMDAETMGKLASMLTEEQKAYVKEMQAYLTGLGEKGNTVSRKLYGIDIFTEEHYFPIKVKSEYLKSQTGPSGDPNIKNKGMTKDVKPDADNPLVLQDFDRVMVDHINSMASYHAFVLPLEDLTRVLNYKPSNAQIDEDGNWSVDETKKDYSTLKAVIESKYGDQANAYIIQLIRNLNGGVRSDSAAGIIDRGITAFKRASTMMSASVIIQQPTSIARAFAYIDPKYFANLAGIDFKNHKERYEMVKKYAPVAIIKEMGGYDTGVGTRTGDYLNAAEYKTFGEKFSAFIKPKMFGGDPNYRAEVFGMGASYADEMAWIQIFEALVNEQADILKKPKESEEVRKAAGKRFEYVVRRTQVYDSTLTRSEYMRSKDTGVKMVTAFMAEPTTVVSMAADAIIRAERGDTKFLRRTAGAIAGSVLLNALLVSLVYAMRNDDEEETYGEKYLSSLATELVDGVNPAGYFPVLRDVVSIMQGYEVERSDMTLIQNLFDQVENITSSKRTVADKMFGVSGAVAAFFGVPMNNVYRDAKGLMNTVIGQVDTETTTGKGVSKALKEEFTTIFGLFDEQTTNQYQLYQAAVSGDTKHYNRVAARYESEKDVEMALRTALRENDKRIAEAAEARISGELEAYKSLIEQIEGEGHFDRDIIIRAINNEMNAIKREEEKGQTVPRDEQAAEEEEASESIYKSTDLNEALERGDKEDYLDVYATLLAYKKEQGKTEAQAKASIKSSITVYWKKKYLLAWEENNQTEIKRIQSILLSTGIYGTRNDVAEMGQKWVKDYAESKNKK